MSRILRHVGNKDFKRTRQRQIGEQKERAAQKLKEWQEAEAERKQIEEIARPFKSDWREETQLQESDWTPVAGSIANSSAQTFHYATPNLETGEPIAVNVSGLGGVESVPSAVTIDSGFGDISSVDAPNYSQLGLQGYAPPLGGVQRQTQQSENERIDAEIRKLEEQIKESKAKETAAIDAWNAELRATMDRHGREWEAVLKKDGVYNPEKHKGLQARHDAEIEAIWSKEPKTEPYETERQNLRTKIFDLENQRPINQQLDASQQAYPNLPMMNARVQSAAGTNTKEPIIPPQPTDDLLDTLVKPLAGDAKDVFDYYSDTFLQNPTDRPVDATRMISRQGMNYFKNLVKDLENDPNFENMTRIDKETFLNQRYDADVEKVDNNPYSMAIPFGLRNVTGTRDTPKDDGFHIDSNGKYTFTKAYDFTDESDLAGAGGGLTGIFALKYANGKPALMRSLESGESPTMNIRLHIPVRKRRKRNRRGRVVESTWSRLKKNR